MKQYVFFDIDGTLLPPGEKEIPKSTIQAIEKLKENGVTPFICTGRCYHQAKQFIKQIKTDNYIVSNGQEVVVDGKEIYSYDLSEVEKEEIVTKLEESKVVWGYETREKIYLMESPYAEDVKNKIQDFGIETVEITKEYKGKRIKQFWAFGAGDAIDTLENGMLDKFKGYRWNEESIEIIPLEESKGKAVTKVVGEQEAKTYAFGDGFNDMELLSTVDVGVAMGNAFLELKAVASYVTKNSEDDGIAHGLKEIGLID